MSAIPSYTVICNGCDADTPNGDLGNRTATEARDEATYQGWMVAQPGGKDYCPSCVQNGTAAAQNKRERARQKASRR